MLPQTSYETSKDKESRHFTRADAAKAFGEHILPADERLPVPEAVQLERDIKVGGKLPQEAVQHFRQSAEANEKALEEQILAKENRKESKMSRVSSDRFEFRYQDFNSDNVGKYGRKRNAVGWKYGFPHPDRKRGQVKIPTRVE
jgi:hypothetical protein